MELLSTQIWALATLPSGMVAKYLAQSSAVLPFSDHSMEWITMTLTFRGGLDGRSLKCLALMNFQLSVSYFAIFFFLLRGGIGSHSGGGLGLRAHHCILRSRVGSPIASPGPLSQQGCGGSHKVAHKDP